MQLTVRQHYVPRVYLRAWSDANGKLKILDKTTGKEFSPAVENVCLEKNYYENPKAPPSNELERRFGQYESAFGAARDFLSSVESSAIKLGQPIAEALASALAALPNRTNTLKAFAGTAYFRTPGALTAMREQLEADRNPAATKALEMIESPHSLSMLAFESTLLDRFRRLHISVLHSNERLDTSDWPCFPVAGGTGHANFAYDIGRHGAAVAIMTITPSIAIVFLPNLKGREPIVIPGEMPKSLSRQMNKLIYDSADRWIVRG